MNKNRLLKLIALYACATGLLYLAFWAGYYGVTRGRFFEWFGLTAGLILFAAAMTLFIIFRKKTWAPIQCCLSSGFCLGLCISAFYTVLHITPSRFFGFVLLLVLAGEILQAWIFCVIKYKKPFLGFMLIAEIAACIAVAVHAKTDAALYSQIAYSLGISVFLSMGQFALFDYMEDGMWRTVATSFLIGFAAIVIVTVAAIAAAAGGECGGAGCGECCGDGSGTVGGTGGKTVGGKKAKKIIAEDIKELGR